jgi:DNA-binding transcriptional ArsR family regulator
MFFTGVVKKRNIYIFEYNNISFKMSSKIFKALSDQTRLRIVELLEKREICACEFVSLVKKAQPTVSQHLRILENSGIVKSRKEGKMVIYSLANPKVIDLIKTAKAIER